MSLRIQTALCVALLASVFIFGCSQAEAGGGEKAQPPHASELAPLMGGPPTFWWSQAGEQSAVTVAFGAPFLDSAGTPRRPWAFSSFRPGSSHPLLIFQSIVDLRGAETIGAGVGEFSVELGPAPGLSWFDVTGVDQLSASVEGIY